MYKTMLMLLLIAASSGAAAQLVEIGSDKTIAIYADTATIRRVGDKVIMWEVGDFKAVNKSGNKSFISMRKQQEYVCKEKQIRTLTMILYADGMGKGEVVHTDNKLRNWEPVTPGSYGEFLWRTACGVKR